MNAAKQLASKSRESHGYISGRGNYALQIFRNKCLSFQGKKI
jgi:hypothetical protein